MRFCPRFLAIAAVCVLGAGAYAQAPNLEPKTPQDKRVPTVTYELVLPGEMSAHYAISVESSGNAAYRSRAIGAGDQEQIATGDAHILKFTLSQPTCMRIFELARQANYFEHPSVSSVPTLDPMFARSGASFNTLSYSYGPLYSFDEASKSVRNSITYTHPEDPAIRQLTSIFESISRSVESGRIAEAANAQ
jgi:hypothetical protein